MRINIFCQDIIQGYSLARIFDPIEFLLQEKLGLL